MNYSFKYIIDKTEIYIDIISVYNKNQGKNFKNVDMHFHQSQLLLYS